MNFLVEKILVFDSLSDLGSWVTIISSFITAYTAYMVFRIRRKFLFRANMEKNCQEIQKNAEELSALLSNFNENKNSIDEILATTNVILRTLEKGASEDFLKDIKKCRQSIKVYSKKKNWFFLENSNQTENHVRDIKTNMSVIVAESKFVQQSLVIGH